MTVSGFVDGARAVPAGPGCDGVDLVEDGRLTPRTSRIVRGLFTATRDASASTAATSPAAQRHPGRRRHLRLPLREGRNSCDQFIGFYGNRC